MVSICILQGLRLRLNFQLPPTLHEYHAFFLERWTAFWTVYHSKKSPTVGPTGYGPLNLEYPIARSQLTERGPLGFGPIQFLMEPSLWLHFLRIFVWSRPLTLFPRFFAIRGWQGQSFQLTPGCRLPNRSMRKKVRTQPEIKISAEQKHTSQKHTLEKKTTPEFSPSILKQKNTHRTHTSPPPLCFG